MQDYNHRLRQVQYYCSEERIANAKKVGKQWLIPAEAEIPMDRRTATGKTVPSKAYYHFPLLTHSFFCSHKEDLNKDEQVLLDAQFLLHSGQCAESVRICRKIVDNCTTVYILAGAYTTLCYNAIFSGMNSLFEVNIKELEKIAEKDSVHYEDLKLIYEELKHHVGWSSSGLNTIDTSKLSQDAILYYQMSVLTRAALNKEKYPASVLNVLETMCLYSDRNKIYSLSISMHSLLASFYSNIENQDRFAFHFHKACDIAESKNLLLHFSKYLYFFPYAVNDYWKYSNPEALSKVMEYSKKSHLNWKLFLALQANIPSYEVLSSKDHELVMLLAYKMTEKDMSAILNLSVNEVKTKIHNMLKKHNLSNKNELVVFFKKRMAQLMKEKNIDLSLLN